jgi:acid phosphatase family membrane protein YuiD
MSRSFADLFANQALWIPISAAISVQLYKFFTAWIRSHTFHLHVLFTTGRMPSSHSALVCSLAAVTGMQYGLGSAYFAISAIFALVVMYDARGVRQESGHHARILNRMVREVFSGHPISDEDYRELKELLGHTAGEVLVGALVGIVYAAIAFALLGFPAPPI